MRQSIVIIIFNSSTNLTPKEQKCQPNSLSRQFKICVHKGLPKVGNHKSPWKCLHKLTSDFVDAILLRLKAIGDTKRIESGISGSALRAGKLFAKISGLLIGFDLLTPPSTLQICADEQITVIIKDGYATVTARPPCLSFGTLSTPKQIGSVCELNVKYLINLKQIRHKSAISGRQIGDKSHLSSRSRPLNFGS
ncbi:hypothetical protein EDD53_1735 [Pacificibacter maritimus]|uniref:Uncharacterized protein n=1 Tax=Pacificibacter maritimus TaxID=762213 RepID=A0A3N4UJ81_9RHOB|nr:hypothetical protein EDD53_1735 [Pacificibacter maritimus]